MDWFAQVEFVHWIPFIFGAIAISGFAIVVVTGIRQAKRVRENLARLGSEMNLSLIEPEKKSVFMTRSTSLEGTLRGHSIRIYSYTQGSGKSRTYWCGVQVGAENNRNLTLSISSENVFTRLGEKLGFDQAKVGDDSFDKQFYVKCSDEDFLRAALIPEVKARFLEVWKQNSRGKIVVDGGFVKYSVQGNYANKRICAAMPAVSELLCDVAEIVETHSRLV